MGGKRVGAEDFMNNIVDAGKKVSVERSLRDVAEEYLKTLKPDIRGIVEGIVDKLDVIVKSGMLMLRLGDVSVEMMEFNEYFLAHEVELLLHRAGVRSGNLGFITLVLTQIIKDYLRSFEGGGKPSLSVEITHVSVREELAYQIAKNILEKKTIKTFYATSSDRQYEIGVYCWDGVSYRPCEEELKAEIGRMVSANEGLTKKTTRWVVNEGLMKIKILTLTKLSYEPLMIAFDNGLVLDWKSFLETGSLRGSLHRANPELIVFHRIPHRLAVERLEQVLKGLEKFDESMIQTVEDVERLAEKLCPKSLKTFKEWVGEKWILLFEIIGYTLYPKYDMHKSVMLVGDGNNGKSTYCNLIRDILGPWNVSNIKLQDLCSKYNRFAKAELYHKLANIFPDLPEGPLEETGDFKALTGEDPITADRKFKSKITFVNYAKLIFSANYLPPVRDATRAFWRRWLVIEFPNQFPLDPTFYERTFTEEEKEGIILVSLIAFRLAWKRRRFSFEETEADYKEYWLRKTNTVYAFIQDLLAGKIEGVKAEKDKNGRVETKKLYSIYVEYCEGEEIEPVDKRRFTIEMERLGYQRVKVRGEYYYKGIKLIEENQSTLS